MIASETPQRKPQFIIIGAVKGATTWTARAVAAHPGVFIPGPEPHYFSSEFERGPAWYLSLFDAAPPGVLIGEKSADYLAHQDAAKRIAAFAPTVRLVAQLRNPAVRAYSDYCMLYRRGTVREGPAAYFSANRPAAESERFLNGGLYAGHLRRFFDHFPRDQMLVLLYDDIMNAPVDAYNRILSHIGLPADATDVAAERQNDSAAPLLPLSLRNALRPFKNAVKPLRGSPLFKAVRGLFAREVAYPPLCDSARAFLDNYYREDIAALEAMLGIGLERWRAGAAPVAAASDFGLHPAQA